MDENQIGRIIVNCAYKVHIELGPGLLESTYEECLRYELPGTGLNVEQQRTLPVVYKNVKLDYGYKIDLLIGNKVVVELKAVEALNDVHLAQILTYLKLSDSKLGFLINFNVKYIKNGIRRVVNKLDGS